MLKKYADKKTETISNASVLGVKLNRRELTVWRKKHEGGKTADILTTFFVTGSAHIKDTNGKALELLDIKPGARVTVDYTRESSGRYVASNIIVTPKQRRGGEGGWLE